MTNHPLRPSSSSSSSASFSSLYPREEEGGDLRSIPHNLGLEGGGGGGKGKASFFVGRLDSCSFFWQELLLRLNAFDETIEQVDKFMIFMKLSLVSLSGDEEEVFLFVIVTTSAGRRQKKGKSPFEELLRPSPFPSLQRRMKKILSICRFGEAD